MTKDICAICGKKLGLFGNFELSDGAHVCTKCARRNGHGIVVKPDEMLATTLEEFLSHKPALEKEKQEKVRLDKSFTADKTLENLVFIDSKNLLFKVNSKFNIETYHLKDVTGYEIVENSEIKTSGGLGRAALGGILFGGPGAVVGAVTGRKNKEAVKTLQIQIKLNSEANPVAYIDLLNSKTKKQTLRYDAAVKKADYILASLDIILKKLEKE
ncbi:DUF4428 domain-containing protein [Listeria monocytogenes]|uniref:DUF4428 domain-containing protein n=1 Tax=Listeria monocytogenes TaxID=1639 RepID=UPI0006924061|nr:DUF4428 domain-containing protein [Listeria monocytogenes]EAE3174230.1 DUF4428 domain-containing protein [Listeria monocytogenes]EAE6578261.1 DUF4428 domain-containing protein [Listeria monocytogenes]EJC8850358.1 DUF4428 domain-containing protein [Listeria monocytogenes]EJD3260416.1 DUF4428 domain-containing protein [Listeria monocytogenes]EJD7574469.1 DUF4428 domain-containing protein [Listeria monocytogenes]